MSDIDYTVLLGQLRADLANAQRRVSVLLASIAAIEALVRTPEVGERTFGGHSPTPTPEAG